MKQFAFRLKANARGINQHNALQRLTKGLQACGVTDLQLFMDDNNMTPIHGPKELKALDPNQHASFADWFKTALKIKNTTYEELAKRLDVTKTTIHRWATGNPSSAVPKADYVRKIAAWAHVQHSSLAMLAQREKIARRFEFRARKK